MNRLTPEFQKIESKIYTLRGIKVMLDRDLAQLYGVETRVLNQSTKRNQARFPSDFMFQLTPLEWESLRSQSVILENKGRGYHLKYIPYAFTEQGVAMLSTVLKSKIAIEINIRIMRAFVEIRQMISTLPEYEVLKQTVKQIESRMDTIEANHLVDHTIIAGKVTHLSKDTRHIREDVRHFSEILDHFQNTHIIIKRPEEDILQG